MDPLDILVDTSDLLDRWGWIQHRDETEEGLDLVSAIEVATGLSLRNALPDEDRVLDLFLDPGVDVALRTLARVVGPIPDEEPLPDQRWAWVHALTCFNDAPATTANDVRVVLAAGRDVLTASLR